MKRSKTRRTTPPRETSSGWDDPTPPPGRMGIYRRYKASLRAGKNYPRRIPGASQGRPPEGAHCAFLPSSRYQLAVRLFLKAGFDLTTRAILDTGSGPTLIYRRYLPDNTPLQPLGDLAKVSHDVNGGWLPIVGSVCLCVTLGGQISYISFGVVTNMSVPAILGTSFIDAATKNIATQEQHVELLNGTKVPIKRREGPRGRPDASTSAVCACPGGITAQLKPARKTWVQPGTIAHVPVRSTFTGHGLVKGRPPLYHKHGIQVAQGPAIMTAGEPMAIQVMHLGVTPLRLTTDMTTGYIETHEGPTYEVTESELEELAMPIKGVKDPPLPEVDVSSVPTECTGPLEVLLKKHASLWEGNLGLIRGVEHRIRLKPGAVAVRQHPYKAGSMAREREKAEVERMRSMEVIEPASGEWASPVVMIPKPDGSVRFYIEYRRLNLMTVKDAYPIPRMDECIDSLGDARVFSTLDCNAGYWQIPVAEEDKYLTAFKCHTGAWKCVRLPFGLCNAAATFQRAMDMILAGVKWQICLVHLEDVIVFSRSPEEHLQHLYEVLTQLGKAGVTLKASKCHFFQEEVEYLRHVTRPGRVHVLKKNIRRLRGLRYPETQTQMKSCLGMCGVHRRFVASFAKIAKPLKALTGTKLPKKRPPPSGDETEAFETLRGRLLDAAILALPQRHGHYIVDVDASYEQLRCCLQQQQPDGEYHPIGYYSRALLPAEKNYFATEIEALGVVWAVTCLRSYLEGAEFVVRCDHRAL